MAASLHYLTWNKDSLCSIFLIFWEGKIQNTEHFVVYRLTVAPVEQGSDSAFRLLSFYVNNLTILNSVRRV